MDTRQLAENRTSQTANNRDPGFLSFYSVPEYLCISFRKISFVCAIQARLGTDILLFFQ